MGLVTVSLPVSEATIASRPSLAPEYVSRVLHELESENRDFDQFLTRLKDALPTIYYPSRRQNFRSKDNESG